MVLEEVYLKVEDIQHVFGRGRLECFKVHTGIYVMVLEEINLKA